MPIVVANIDDEYKKNKSLRREDVKSLQEWAEKQPHLPKLTELQVIHFLHSCHYSNETAKNTIDTFFTVKTLCPEIFANRSPNTAAAKAFMNVTSVTPLPQATPEGYRVILVRMVDCNPDKYIFTEQIKHFDMANMLWLNQEGTNQGQIIIIDQEGVVLGHLGKLEIMPMKKYLYYLQEALPVRLKGLHFINIAPFIDKVLAIMKPFMKKELMDMLHLHSKMETLYKYVPQECLPKDYGGSAESVSMLHEKQKKNLMDNGEFFAKEEKEVADESKRQGKPKNAGEIFGVEGTFKKLDID